MSRAIAFSPDSQNRRQDADTIASADLEVQKMLQQERDKVRQITNYLEALHARLLAETKGSTALAMIADATRHNSTQTV